MIFLLQGNWGANRKQALPLSLLPSRHSIMYILFPLCCLSSSAPLLPHTYSLSGKGVVGTPDFSGYRQGENWELSFTQRLTFERRVPIITANRFWVIRYFSSTCLSA